MTGRMMSGGHQFCADRNGVKRSASRTYTRKLDYIGRSLGVRWTPVQRGPKRERRRCVIMTAFEIISIIIGILSLLIAFGSLIVAFLAFLDKRNKRK